MTKAFFAIAALLSTTSAFAFPNVGNQAVYEITEVKDGQTIVTTSTAEITQFDEANKKFFIRRETHTPGQPNQVDEGWSDASELPSDESTANLLNECEGSVGGKIENITVPAGNFTACAIPVAANDKVWIAKVPFGLVSSTSVSDGASVSMVLKSFH